LKTLDIHVITVPVLRLDKSEDQEKLKITVEQLRPKLLILDPFVRLHRIDENSSGEVAPILASLREIQRAYHTAIIVVHHAKKSTGALRAGQTLRGSSEFHAWGDVNLYLRRNREDQLNLTIEHRDGKSQSDIKIELTDEKEGIQMKVLKNENTSTNTPQVLSLNEKLFKLFNDELTPLPLIEIRARVGARAETVNKVVSEMLINNQLCKVAGGYQLVR
jgi:RecA-family ATPase